MLPLLVELSAIILGRLGDFFEHYVRMLVEFVTNYLPVKVIRDEKGIPFLYRYHLFTLYKDGPGMCIHHFVKSDPDRGYHDHPWTSAISFILCGGYQEKVLKPNVQRLCLSDSFNHPTIDDAKDLVTYQRKRFTFNYLDGSETFHRVLIADKTDAWTIFAFRSRTKIWNMINLGGKIAKMSDTVSDKDGGWWNIVGTGYGINNHVEHSGKVIPTVDIIVVAEGKVLLIKRGKNPFAGCWAFPGGRIEEKDQTILAAAKRELKEETNLIISDLEYFTSIGNNTRDPRGFTLTNVFVTELDEIPVEVRAGDDAVDYEWFSLSKLPTMAFDHSQILDLFMTQQAKKKE